MRELPMNLLICRYEEQEVGKAMDTNRRPNWNFVGGDRTSQRKALSFVRHINELC
jgi:hypothetical protein